MWQWREEIQPGAAGQDGSGVAWEWHDLESLPPCYAMLAISPTARPPEIRSAYRRRARALHPDHRCEAEQAAAQREMAAVNRAYAILRDPVLRAAYDQGHGLP